MNKVRKLQLKKIIRINEEYIDEEATGENEGLETEEYLKEEYVGDYEYEEYTLLSFAFEGHWSTPLYLYDALTNDSIQITNGLQVAVRTPESDQIRYFINGSNRVTSEENQQGTATGIEEVNDQLPNTNYQSGTVIYDVLGRKIMTLNEYDLISNIHLPTGVYIIQRGSNTERMVIR